MEIEPPVPQRVDPLAATVRDRHQRLGVELLLGPEQVEALSWPTQHATRPRTSPPLLSSPYPRGLGYAIANEELASIRVLAAHATGETDREEFVDSAEAAIFREHTMWRASRTA
jgi:hypothetical protein